MKITTKTKAEALLLIPELLQRAELALVNLVVMDTPQSGNIAEKVINHLYSTHLGWSETETKDKVLYDWHGNKIPLRHLGNGKFFRG